MTLWASLALLMCLSGGGSARADLPPTITSPAKQPGLVVFSGRDLDFGDVLPGVPATVSPGDGASARWFIRGTRGAEVNLTFLSLPSNLLDASNNQLSMSYGTNDAAFFVRNQPGNATTFDPVAGTRTRLHPGSGRLVVWLGGTAIPTAGQVPNPYENTITLDVTYTGN